MRLYGVWYFDPPFDQGWLSWEGRHGRPQRMEFDAFAEAALEAERQSSMDRRSIYLPAERRPEEVKEAASKSTPWRTSPT